MGGLRIHAWIPQLVIISFSSELPGSDRTTELMHYQQQIGVCYSAIQDGYCSSTQPESSQGGVLTWYACVRRLQLATRRSKCCRKDKCECE